MKLNVIIVHIMYVAVWCVNDLKNWCFVFEVLVSLNKGYIQVHGCDVARGCLNTSSFWKHRAAELLNMATELEQLRQEAEQLKAQIRVGTYSYRRVLEIM